MHLGLPVRLMWRGRAPSSQDLAFFVFFALYTAVSVTVLLFGLASALAVLVPQLKQAFYELGGSTLALAPIWRAVVSASNHPEPGPQVLIDFLLSALNLGLGLLLVWHRPYDRVTRLLGLGMVGTAMAFNFATHGVLAAAYNEAAVRPLNVAHFVLHAVSGVTYLHALVVFPDGRIAPRGFRWIVLATYIVTAQELLFTLFGGVYLPKLGLPHHGLFAYLVHLLFSVNIPLRDLDAILHGESTLFALFFSVLMPSVALVSQLYRYRRAGVAERQQTGLVVQTMAFAFTLGLAAMLLSFVVLLTRGAGDEDPLEQFEAALVHIMPPLLAVVPLSLFVSIVRHRLFELELILSRTAVLGVLTASLALLFVTSQILLQHLFANAAGEKSDLAIIGSTLVNVALFQPVRRRLERLLGRRLLGQQAGTGSRTTAPSG